MDINSIRSSIRPRGSLARVARFAALTALVAAAGAGPVGAQESGIAVGRSAPDAAMETLDGKPARLALLRADKPAIIEFWAIWCPNCKELEPALRAAEKKYATSVQFIGVAVSVNESPELVRRYVERHRIAGVQLYDRKGSAVDAFGVPATSFVVVINKAGKVVYTGLGGTQDIEAAIKKAL